MDGNNFILKLLCLDPCRSFQSLATQKPYSFIITSGTLSPLNFWQYELGLKFPRPLACPHFLTDSQLFASVVTCGPSKQPFNFNYDNRSNRAMVLDLGKILV
jgi:Rad3-related DNA helicase